MILNPRVNKMMMKLVSLLLIITVSVCHSQSTGSAQERPGAGLIKAARGAMGAMAVSGMQAVSAFQSATDSMFKTFDTTRKQLRSAATTGAMGVGMAAMQGTSG